MLLLLKPIPTVVHAVIRDQKANGRTLKWPQEISGRRPGTRFQVRRPWNHDAPNRSTSWLTFSFCSLISSRPIIVHVVDFYTYTVIETQFFPASLQGYFLGVSQQEAIGHSKSCFSGFFAWKEYMTMRSLQKQCGTRHQAAMVNVYTTTNT
jgi:hypothetical protein